MEEEAQSDQPQCQGGRGAVGKGSQAEGGFPPAFNKPSSACGGGGGCRASGGVVVFVSWLSAGTTTAQMVCAHWAIMAVSVTYCSTWLPLSASSQARTTSRPLCTHYLCYTKGLVGEAPQQNVDKGLGCMRQLVAHVHRRG